MAQRVPLVPLCELPTDQECDTFGLLSRKEEATTREGKPYWMVTFRDARMEFTFPVWCDSQLAQDCRTRWTVGCFYKIRAVRRDTRYGPQLEIRRIREVTEQDRETGFDPLMCLPQSERPPEELYQELAELVSTEIQRPEVRELVLAILRQYKDVLLTLPAARSHHHAYVGGWLEHTLSVVETCVFLADKYRRHYPQLDPPLDRDLVIAGGVLHDIGKVRELSFSATAADYTEEGALIGHLLLGRDMVREAATQMEIDRETLLRLEHLIIAHQRLPEWGSPKPPMTPEALIVHYADDLDAKFHMFYHILRTDTEGGALTGDRNLLRQKLFRGKGKTNPENV